MRRGKVGQGHEKRERDVGSCLSTEKRGKENKTKMKGSMKYLVIKKTEKESRRKTEQQGLVTLLTRFSDNLMSVLL